MTISKQQARHFLLSYHKLHQAKGVQDLTELNAYLHKIRALQIDPINIVGRSPELTLLSRYPQFRAENLFSMIYSERLYIEYFDKEMCAFPIEDWPYFDRTRQIYRDLAKTRKREKELLELKPLILQEIEKRGALCSNDLAEMGSVTWHWGTKSRVSKAVMEYLYYCGDLVVSRKEKNRKYYDLPERIIPPHIFKQTDPNGSEEEYSDWYVERRIRSIGLTWNKSGQAWLRTPKAGLRRKSLERMVQAGKIIEVKVQGIEHCFYTPADALGDLESPAAPVSRCTFLAPLENMIWDREQCELLFNFKYIWEIYKPAEQRSYGYYVLPVLYGDEFIARCEPFIDKETQTLELRGWWWESGVTATKLMIEAILSELSILADFMNVTLAPDIHSNIP